MSLLPVIPCNRPEVSEASSSTDSTLLMLADYARICLEGCFSHSETPVGIVPKGVIQCTCLSLVSCKGVTMLVACSNSNCTIQFAGTLRACPRCGSAPESRVEPFKVEMAPTGVRTRGRVLLYSVEAGVILLNLIPVYLMKGDGIAWALFRTLIELGMLIAIYHGGEIIRTFWVFRAIVGFVITTYLFATSGGWGNFLGALFCAYSVYVVRFSHSVSAFISNQDSRNGTLR